jgi:hypothetical protein
MRYRQVPWHLRLHYKDAPGTFVFNEATKGDGGSFQNAGFISAS